MDEDTKLDAVEVNNINITSGVYSGLSQEMTAESGESQLFKMTRFDPVEGIPHLPVDGLEYDGIPGNIQSYLIDIPEPGWYNITINQHEEVLLKSRIYLFMEHSLNTPVIDGGFYNQGMKEFLYATRYRLVVHGMTVSYKISVGIANESER